MSTGEPKSSCQLEMRGNSSVHTSCSPTAPRFPAKRHNPNCHTCHFFVQQSLSFFFFSFDKFLTDAFSSYTLPEINFNFTRNSPLSLTLYIQPLYRRVKPPVENLGQNCTSRDVFPSTNTKKQTKRNLKTINNKVSNTTKQLDRKICVN